MNFKDLQKELKAIKGVSNLSLIRQNVIKIDLEKSVSKSFFTKLKEDFYFEHCSLITAVGRKLLDLKVKKPSWDLSPLPTGGTKISK